ncbi:mRNA-decapping enzyme subunit 2 [Lecanora helva]
MDEVILVKGWKKGANWSFPRGKINKDELDLECAIREVYEETGYDVEAAGLVPNQERIKYIEMNLREQHMRLYVFRGIPMNTHFEPRTRKEISKIQWWKLSDLPTSKKKNHQQDGQGGDPASNANKFYMVAPFLPQLKKWISGQRKLDKTRAASSSAPIPALTDEETTPLRDSNGKEGNTLPSINGNMSKLLESLRQSALPGETNGPTGIVPIKNQDTAAQLKDVLGVPTGSRAVKATEGLPASKHITKSKADSLLTLLQDKPTLQTSQIPQTPADQVIEHPRLPASPPHPHHQPPRFSSMPPPPAFPIQDQMPLVSSRQHQPPQVRPIPPPQNPAQLVSRNTQNQGRQPYRRAMANKQTVAPYMRTGDPQFAQPSHIPNSEASSIPRADKLPPPKLNAQSSALLNLFKAGTPAESSRGLSKGDIPTTDEEQVVKEIPILGQNRKPEGPRHAKGNVRENQPQQASRASNMFVPPQVLSRADSAKSTTTSKPEAGRQNALLNLFKNPSLAATEPAKPGTPTLQLPSTPAELSAMPKTPSHSREPSRTNEDLEEPKFRATQNKSSKFDSRPRQNTASLHSNPPVSATINGPLNIPQFDMVAKSSQDARQTVNEQDHGEAQKRSPIRILTRPPSSHNQPSPTQQKIPIKKQQQQQRQGDVATNPPSFVTPVKKPPPTPDLKAHEAPPKAFQPQILRRPAHLDDPSEPSPIQPLPSPQHNAFPKPRPTQPGDHKKSLLSLFTKPSPVISPPSAAPISAIDPSALISPLAGPSPEEKADAAFARLSKSVGKLSSPGNGETAQDLKNPPLRTDSIDAVAAEGSKNGHVSEKQTPVSKTTPTDKAFYLGFLNSVAEGKK